MITLREKFQLMRKIIIEQQEVSETEFILLLDDYGIGQATYNKIKKDFRKNSKKAGIHYDEKERIYRIGAKQTTLYSTVKEELK